MFVLNELIIIISILALLAIYFSGSILASVVRFTLEVDFAQFWFHCNPNDNVCT